MKKIDALSLESMTDKDLNDLHLSVCAERIKRADKKTMRENWVKKYYNLYQNSTARAVWVGETVVIAIKWMGHIKMAAATPVNGDEFDTHTGIAVAYAKACGERIPDFV
jgi:hypothetical protein